MERNERINTLIYKWLNFIPNMDVFVETFIVVKQFKESLKKKTSVGVF